MKVLQINIFGNLSTGRIAVDLYRTLRDNGHEGLFAFARNQTEPDVPHYIIGSKASIYLDGFMTRLTDRAGFYSKAATQKLIKKIKEYDPDIIHLHNLHGYYLNIELLFKYLRECGKPVVWTLHDCWAFTGHCCHYSLAGCDRWMIGCEKCPQLKVYPKSVFMDSSKRNYFDKKKLFTTVPNLTLVCVSHWLENEVKKSFLKELPCEVIHNGIDLNVFKHTDSQVKTKYGITDKKMLLAVSTSWSEKSKGLEDVLQLAMRADGKYAVVVVGLTDEEKKKMPEVITAITRTDNTQELAELYSAADYYFNASVEETFGLPTVEAMACGTPVIVYNATALPEVVTNKCGFVVEPHDLDAVNEIVNSQFQYSRWEIRAAAAPYSKEQMMKKYLSLYKRLLTTH